MNNKIDWLIDLELRRRHYSIVWYFAQLQVLRHNRELSSQGVKDEAPRLQLQEQRARGETSILVLDLVFGNSVLIIAI